MINLQNGLTALLISDTHSVTDHRAHRDSDVSTTDDDEDTCSADLEDESDDDDDDDDGADDVDGVVGGDLDGEQVNDGERSRQSKDAKPVSTCTCCVLWFLHPILTEMNM